MTKIEDVTLVASTKNNGVTINIYRVVFEACNMTRVEYHVNAYTDEDEVIRFHKTATRFYNETFATLSLAFADLHRFLMCEYANSTYATDDDDEDAYIQFR